MKKTIFKGAGVAIITPFTEDGVNFEELSRIIEDDYMRSHRKLQSRVGRKLRRIIEQKKEDLGIKVDNTIHYDY